jgi:hypothetical protein
MPRKKTIERNDDELERKPPAREGVLEEHIRPAELAKRWGVSPGFIRERFRKEPGVIRIGQEGSASKRSYRVMLIPASVAERVYVTLRVAS